MNKLLIGVGVVALVAVGSVGVWQLSGADRRVGALGPVEKPIPLAWRGAWIKDAEYAEGEVVSYRDSSYVAETANAGQAPNSAESPWALMAARGLQGPAGTFSGTLQSPNGSYSLVVADTGIVMQGPGGSIKLQDTATQVIANRTLTVQTGQDLRLDTSGGTVIKSGSTITVEAGGVLHLKGSLIRQN